MTKHDTLLVACGDPENRKLLRTVLGGAYHLLEAGNTRQALMLLDQNRSCIAAMILDISNPDLVDKALLQRQDTEKFLSRIPVIAITADEQQGLLDRAFAFGAADVIPIGYDAYAMVRRIENIVQLHLHKENLEEMVKEQAEILRHSNQVMVDALSSIIEYRSVESGQHILRIRRFTKALLEQVAEDCPEYSLTPDVISIISSASALHDVGKIGIPDSVLTKPGPLNREERELMKTHTIIGCRILESLSDIGSEDYLRYAHNICHYHHERWDGGGYPEGLSGEGIPICAQVVGLVDAYDALTTKRVYKDAFAYGTAVNMILSGECGVFSPKLLESFKRILPQLEELSRAYADGLSPKTERFDVTLPEPETVQSADSLELLQGKYQNLLHYIDAFVMEVSLDGGYFHLLYNPYPELTAVKWVNDLRELEQLILEQVVAPQERQQMEDLFYREIPEFFRQGLRRRSFRFRFRNRSGQLNRFEVTLLRTAGRKDHRVLTVLCRKLSDTPEQPDPGAASEFSELELISAADSDFLCRNDEYFTLVRGDNRAVGLIGFSPAEVRGRFGGKLIELIHPEDREKLRQSFREQFLRGNDAQTEIRLLHKDGGVRWVLDKAHRILGRDGQEYLSCHLTDISDAMQDYDQLYRKLERYEIILAQTENVLFEWDAGSNTVAFSDTWKNIFGSDPIRDNVIGHLREGSLIHPDDLPLLMDRVHSLENGSDYEMAEVRMATARGRYLWCRFRATAIRDKRGNLERIAGLIINIDEEKQSEQALQDRADRDALTKLLNKDAGRRYAEAYLAQFPQGVSCALMIIDLDNFKQVNDSYGHLFGDTVLTKVSREIRKLFRAQDIVARIGGDEFMVLMRGVSDRMLVQNRCDRLHAIFRTAFRELREKLNFGCSVGVSLSPEHGTSYVELFRRADQALYRAKDLGKGSSVIFDGQDWDFLQRTTRDSAVSNHIDSDDQPGLAENSLVQYAFQRLYASRNVDESIGELLALVGRQTNVSRVYVFENSDDNRFCSNTYEWCNTGVHPEIHNLQNVSYETDIPGFDRQFDEHDIFYCPDITALPRNLYDILAPQGIKSILHCAIRDNGVFRGYIGFDECEAPRLWTKEQIDLLTYFAGMLSVFLLKMRSQQRIERHADDLHSILDNQNAWIYVVDPETCRLKYLNAKARALTPGARTGMYCYEAIRRCSSRCPGCPMGQKNGRAVLSHPENGEPIQAETADILWEGEPSCLVTCRELQK